MFERQERLAILLLIGVAIMVVASHLVLDNMGKRPFATHFTDVSEDGELVILTGTIDHLGVTKQGDHLLLQINNTSVFITNKVAKKLTLQNGQNISMIGIV